MGSTLSSHGAPPRDERIVFFDGECIFCNGSVDFVLRRPRGQLFQFAPLQGKTARTRLGVAPERLLTGMALLDGGRFFFGGEAALQVLRILYPRISAPMRILHFPPFSWAVKTAYFVIARYRYQWFGKQTCRVPSPQERALFLE